MSDNALFEYLNSINYNKEYKFGKDLDNKDYNQYQINRGLSFFPDTILHSNLMNRYSFLPSNIQHDFLFHSIRSRKRFSKWFKPTKNDDIELIQEYYKCNRERATEALSILSKEQIDEIRKTFDRGGIR